MHELWMYGYDAMFIFGFFIGSISTSIIYYWVNKKKLP